MRYSRDDMTLPKGPFETERLVLTPLGLQHEQAIWEMFSDPDFVRFVPFELATDRAASEALFHEQIEAGERFKFHLGVDWKNPPSGLIKTAGFAMCRPSEDGDKMEIGYCVHPGCWGKGLGSEIAASLANDVAVVMGAAREDLMAKVESENKGSVRIVEKLGFHVAEKATEEGREILTFGLQA